jgi:RNA polymerase sigma-70 factor, ECF subfamily
VVLGIGHHHYDTFGVVVALPAEPPSQGEHGAPQRALELVDSLELSEYRYFHSTRAELLRRLGRDDEARQAFGRALRLTTTDVERRFLMRRLSKL